MQHAFEYPIADRQPSIIPVALAVTVLVGILAGSVAWSGESAAAFRAVAQVIFAADVLAACWLLVGAWRHSRPIPVQYTPLLAAGVLLPFAAVALLILGNHFAQLNRLSVKLGHWPTQPNPLYAVLPFWAMATLVQFLASAIGEALRHGFIRRTKGEIWLMGLASVGLQAAAVATVVYAMGLLAGGGLVPTAGLYASTLYGFLGVVGAAVAACLGGWLFLLAEVESNGVRRLQLRHVVVLFQHGILAIWFIGFMYLLLVQPPG